MPSPAFPTEPTTLSLPGPAGALEAVVDPPEPGVAALPVVAIVCHPLSTDGGTMHNKVVTMAARALRELGIATVRFNFRSVGASQGEFDHGVGELDDLRAVAAWVREQRPHAALWLAGFSFGSYVALRGARELGADAVISIAPPVAGRGWDFGRIDLPEVPWLVVMGEADEIVAPQAVFDWVDALPRKPVLVRMPDTSHFFHRKLIDLRAAIQDSVRGWLPHA
ncbi:alpha/beta hydrolase [Pseudoxanthomonas sangjuensis]|uniref:alpha/beta hydrolase n=1 Tax=Pseudoxanthomonas sangjuensis TaxID=1503750 RepID=UPI00139088F3|nr:alpha/beta family hydrolase [Pseudoxanthomonas sangjuensis]KAF1713717.1 alpha/beta hydrolase [Pseudoxanthomonas sangjuensis]